MILTIMTSAIVSLMASFLLGRAYVNAQYHASNAGMRQVIVIEATRTLLDKSMDEGAWLARYSSALAPLLKQCHQAFDSEDKTRLPALQYERYTGWNFYYRYLLPVQQDMNNNGYLGWFHFVHNVKLMTTLHQLVFTAERIIALQEEARAKNAEAIKVSEGLINKTSLAPHDELLEAYSLLETTWKQWLALNAFAKA